MQRDLIDYLTYYNPALMRDIVFDKFLISFDNGVLELPKNQSHPLVFHLGGSKGFVELVMQGRVAYHHIAGEYLPNGGAGTINTLI